MGKNQCKKELAKLQKQWMQHTPIYDDHMAEMTMEPKKTQTDCCSDTIQDNPIALWIKECETYLLELLRLEGRGDYMFAEACPGTSECEGCPEYRCWDCFGIALYCKELHSCKALRKSITQNPVIIKHWLEGPLVSECNSAIQFGDNVATHHQQFHDDFVVLDVNGVHQVAVDFCACEIAQSPTTQLLHVRWFPATTIDPKTACNASAFEVWQTLSRLTDNTGIRTPKIRSGSLLRHCCEWSESGEISNFSSSSGEDMILQALMLPCKDLARFFVQRVLNRAKTYHRVGKMPLQKFRWLYGLFLVIDANFRLARKNVSSDSVDPGLSKGMLASSLQEKSTCQQEPGLSTAHVTILNDHALLVTFRKGKRHGSYRRRGSRARVGKYKPRGYQYTVKWAQGSRCDTLDDHFGDFNWKNLLQKLKAAIPERDQHQCDFNEFNKTLITERMEEVAMWKQGVEKWEADTVSDKPFQPDNSKKRLESSSSGINSSLHNEISPAVLISSGIGIEEEHSPGIDFYEDLSVLGDHATDLQRSKLQDRTNCCCSSKVEQWCQVQIFSLLSSRTTHQMLSVTNDFAGLNGNLRRAQASDALNDLRRHLLLRTHLYKFKDVNIRGRSSIMLRRLAKATASAWTALSSLCGILGEDGWQSIFPVLEPAHSTWNVRGRGRSILKATGHFLGSGRHRVSQQLERFLQTRCTLNGVKPGHTANRWTEEVQLLVEEMQRVREFLSWHAKWWDEQARRRMGLPDAETEGIEGYAKRQASLRRHLQIAFNDMWVTVESSATAEAQL
ncbi:hypothetical protein F4604DRAFT_1684097 [Suillus subluteus]|nr:hypothetical protein F4604DRAFT_1684097 [Suillus subluteus]